jgi:anti-anti-sigma regulatory factor
MRRACILTHRLDDGVWTIVVDGEHDISGQRELASHLEFVFAIGTCIVLDLSRALLIDSSVLRLLVYAHKRAENSSPGSFAVVAPRGRAATRLWDLTRAGTLFTAFSTQADAIDWCRRVRAEPARTPVAARVSAR